MSVIHSVTHQWDKAEFAHQIEQYFSLDKEVMQLFVGATNCQTVCNLIAAMVELPHKSEDGQFEVNNYLLFDLLLQCFLLLYVKEAEHKALSQGEQLILSLTLKLAKLMIDDEQEHPTEILEKSHLILASMGKLESQRRRLRRQRINMGK
ncbi:hypothetical protein ACN0IJ_09755 [Shewanella indica]|uniref:hypothetical protein n=1 Tax=Shewanella indica TaxID=768528 RepID=UPI003D361C7C